MTTSSEPTVSIHVHEVDLPSFEYSINDVVVWLTYLGLTYQKPIQSLEYIICTDAYLLHLNQNHLQHDFYTDILTFPYEYSPIHAEIYISLDRAIDNASRLGVKAEEELLRLFAHGFLHMAGFNDETDLEKEEMRNQENRCISLFLSNEYNI